VVTREWYTKATAATWGSDEWTINPLSDPLVGQSGIQGSANAYAYRRAVANVGVIAGWRYAREPCAPCYVSTFPQLVTVQNAAANAPTIDSSNSMSVFQRMTDFLLPYVVNNTVNGGSFTSAGYVNFIAGYFGADDQSYMIKDCGFMNGGGSAQCGHAGTVRYQLWTTNTNVFGNQTRQVFLIDANGQVTDLIGLGNSPAAPTGIYAVATRGFYVARNGFTNVNSVADASATLNRRFVVANRLPGGEVVVGGEFVDNGGGVCGSSDANHVGLTFLTFLAMLALMIVA
jgi:hypothetical protein